MKTYTRRERVETVLDHREADCVPCDLTIEPTSYGKLCDYFGLKYEPYWWDDWNHAYPSVEILDKLGVDIYHVPLMTVPRGFTIELTDFRDEWGVAKKKVDLPGGGFMYNLMDNPLKDAESVDDILSYPWPEPEDLIDLSHLEEETRYLYNNTDFALTATFGGHIFEQSHYLRGMDNFLMDLLVEPEIACALMNKVKEIHIKLDEMVLNCCGKYLSYMRFNGEDLGTQNGQLISTSTFTELVKPIMQEEWQFTKKHFRAKNPNARIAMHSGGAVFALLPHFAEMGIDIVNPIQPNAKGMDSKRVKDAYGSILSFHGAVDSQGVLNTGSPEKVREEVRTRIRDLAPGGGYICAPSHNIQNSVPVENVIALYDAIHEYGKYPIALD